MKEDLKPWGELTKKQKAEYIDARIAKLYAERRAIERRQFADMMSRWLAPLEAAQRAVAACQHTETYLRVIPETEGDNGLVLDGEVQKRCADKECNRLLRAS